MQLPSFSHFFASMVILPLAVLGCATTEASRDGDGVQSPSLDLSGRYDSGCVQNGEQRVRLDFTNTDTTWAIDYTTYGDAACEVPFLTVHIEGPYEVTGPSSIVPGAHEGRFGFTEKTVTPHMDAAVAFLGSGQGCNREGFVVGEPADIFTEGCPGLGMYPKDACAADYDLVKLEEGALAFGQRPANNDMCSPDKRPKALSGMALPRK